MQPFLTAFRAHPRLWLGALLLAAALALRAATFGNPNLGVDEQFYLLVGERMHAGALPYVDVWDRKPLGLFALYWLFGFSPWPVVTYQLAACLAAAATAWVIALIARPSAGWQGAVLGALAYLLLLGPFDGMGGQAPVFYNLLVAGAAALMLAADADLRAGRPAWRAEAAMALCGLAIAIKPTALFESGFFGLWGLWALGRGGLSAPALAATALRWAALGAAPFVLPGLWYAAHGHGGAWWQAMVLSMLHKQPRPPEQLRFLAMVLAMRGALVAGLAAWGLWRWRGGGRRLAFGGLWLAAAVAGLLSLFTFFAHYALPLLVPLCVAAAHALGHGDGAAGGREWGGRIGFAALALYAGLWFNAFDFAGNRQARADMDQLAALTHQRAGGGRLLVYDGPSYLYALTGQPFVSPLVFPTHLNLALEANVSQFDTARELDRVLAGAPGVVVMALSPRNQPANAYAAARVAAYVAQHCAPPAVMTLHEGTSQYAIGVYGPCRAR